MANIRSLPLWLIFGAVSFVLQIAYANVAGIMRRKGSTAVNFRCVMGIHDFTGNGVESCVCARCGKPIAVESTDLTGTHDTYLLRLSKAELREELAFRLKCHDFVGCKCTRCGLNHVWMRIEHKLIARKDVVVFGGGEYKGLYRSTFKCALCGEKETSELWEQDALG